MQCEPLGRGSARQCFCVPLPSGPEDSRVILEGGMEGPVNSRRTRVRPIFQWLDGHGGDFWPARLVSIAHGLGDLRVCGAKKRCTSIRNVESRRLSRA